MRRMRLDAQGWDAPMTAEVLPDPAAPTGQFVVVEIEACGVCHRDLIDRRGGVPFMTLPITLGHELVGRVTAVGPEVSLWQPGDRVASLHRDSCGDCDQCVAGQVSLCQNGGAHVLGIMADGGYASHVVAPERTFYAMPQDIPGPEAAILNCTYGTAFRGLRAGGCGPGRRVVITGASGGVGSAAVEVAARMGATVVAVVRSDSHVDYVRTLGADVVVVDPGDGFHRHEAVAGADMVLDCVGEPTLNASLRSVRLGGSVVFIGNVSQARLELNVGLVIVKALRIIGSSGAVPDDMADLLELRDGRPFQMAVEEVPLKAAESAHDRLRRGGVAGRLVLRP